MIKNKQNGDIFQFDMPPFIYRLSTIYHVIQEITAKPITGLKQARSTYSVCTV